MLDNMLSVFFFFNDTATTEIYTLSLHDALPILRGHRHQPALLDQGGLRPRVRAPGERDECLRSAVAHRVGADRKSTRLNSSHANISYAVFCLKKKKIPPETFLYLLLILSLHCHI